MPFAKFTPFPNYQANFCAECGVALEANALRRAVAWRACYFCAVCTAERKRNRPVKPVAALIVGTLSAILAFHSSPASKGSVQPNSLSAAATTVPAPVVSAADATAAQHPFMQHSAAHRSVADARVFCGARTKKGTPCRHLVPFGQRCAQHRGMASLLDVIVAPARKRALR